MKARDIYNFDNPKFAKLREPSRDVVRFYQNANRFYDTIQEYVYIEQGMKYCSQLIHRQAHRFPQRFDTFVDMLHERHLMGEYAETPEMNWREELKDMDDVFSVLIDVLENIQEALEKFHAVTDNADFRPMALKTEELMAQNSADYTKWLELWYRYDSDGGSKTSFDSWCKHILDEEGD